MKRILSPAAFLLASALVVTGEPRAVSCPATTDAEWEELVASRPEECTFIRTVEDWRDYKAGARFPGHPLNGLTPQQLADFEARLWIVNGGVASMNIGILQRNLSPAAYENVLRAFGISIIFAEDHKDYYCKSRGTCSLRYFHICTSNC